MKKIVSRCTAVLLVTAVCGFLYFGAVDTYSTETKNPPKKAPKNTVTISFAGDCSLGFAKDLPDRFGATWAKYAPSDYFAGVQALFANDDITFVNLEGALTNQLQVAEKEFSVKGDPRYVSILTEGSVEVCNMVNNHINDCGKNGVAETKKVLTQAGIFYSAQNEPAVMNVNGVNVCFLSYGCWLPKQEWKSIEQSIAAFKATGAVVIVHFHGGYEHTYQTCDFQRETCRHCVDCGADLVVMEHAHVVQGIEVYNNVPIVYGLGNFCFGLNGNPSDKDAYIFQATFDKTGKLESTRVIPCLVSSVSNTNDFKPTYAVGTEYSRILEKLKGISTEFPVSYFADSKEPFAQRTYK